jgi:hypothetical protein
MANTSCLRDEVYDRILPWLSTVRVAMFINGASEYIGVRSFRGSALMLPSVKEHGQQCCCLSHSHPQKDMFKFLYANTDSIGVPTITMRFARKSQAATNRLVVTNLESGTWHQNIRLKLRCSCQHFERVVGVVRLAEQRPPQQEGLWTNRCEPARKKVPPVP